MAESGGELGWFRDELLRSLVHPRSFARSIATEHYGLAGVLVAVIAGIAASVSIDVLVLVSKHLSPASFGSQLVIDALFLGVRLAITVALVATLAHYAAEALRRRAVSVDRAFTALSFALTPLVLVPIPALAIAAIPELLPPAGLLVVLLVARALVGLAFNLRALLPLPLAAVLLAVELGAGAFVMQDQVSRVRFTVYAVAPQLLPALAAAPASGPRFDNGEFSLTLPAGWRNTTSGVRGEAASFGSANGELRVLRARSLALGTADAYADSVGTPERRGVAGLQMSRRIVRVNELVVVDDVYRGTYDGRPILWRQFTAVPGASGLALLFHWVEPADDAALLDEAAAIAATWRIGAR